MIKTILYAILLMQSVTALCQKEDLFAFYKSKFPEDRAVFIERSEVRTITLEEDSLKVVSDLSEDILHLKEQSEGYASNRVHGSYFSQVKDMRAKTLVWEKSRYREVPVSEFKKNSDVRDGIFYDDSYYYSFNFPSIALGNRTQLEYREFLGEPKFMSGFIFSSYLPQAKASFIIKAPKGVELGYKVLNDPKSQIHFKKTDKGNITTYEWTAENLEAFRIEERSPALLYTAPQVVCYVKSYQTKTRKVNVLASLDDLYAWYYTFVRDLNKQRSDQLQKIADDIKKNSKGELELVRNVFYWVQSNIHYIAFEQGMRGFIPHDGSYVCDKRYGDCKDMANLLVDLLDAVGVKAYHTWVGTRDIPYKYTEFATPAVDNHMIATYISPDGNYYFLDATSDHTPFGFPSSMIQGKEVLIGRGDKSYEVKQVPIVSMNENVMTDSITLKLEGNLLTGVARSSLHGYSKVFGAYNLDRSTQDDVKKYVTKLLGKGNNKFLLDSYALAHLEDRDLPTRIDYKFRLSDYHQKVGEEIFVNLNLNKEYYNEFINLELRKTPYENEFKYVKYESIRMEIPAGYKVEYLPEDFLSDNGKFGCAISYSQKDNFVIFSKKFFINNLLLTSEEFAEWNVAIRKISTAYKESVILTMNN